jgi:diguanylate cyclase (GGDEF)-like protein
MTQPPSGARDPKQGEPRSELASRALFEDRLSQALASAQRHAWKPSLLWVQVDHLAAVNEGLGHAVGDELLRCVGQRLCRLVRASDAVTDLGGGELAVLLTATGADIDAARVAEKMIDAFADPVRLLDEHDFFTTLSIGIALFPADGRRPEDVVASARTAVRRAHEQGGNSYQFYTREMNLAALERLSFEQKLRGAAGRGELLLEYQPQVDVVRGRVVGLEALVRWRHPELGLLPPGRFLSIAEESHQMIGIGEWVLRDALRQFRQWRTVLPAGVRLAVNVSPRQFHQPALAERIRAMLGEADVSPERLEIEITESCLMRNLELAMATLHALRDLGVRIAIDDFGTGYSSLSYLKNLPIDTLKIDQSFVRGMPRDPGDSTIVSTVISMARGLNLTTVGEGVETHEQMRTLAAAGCTRMQGALFGMPQSPQAVAEIVREGHFDWGVGSDLPRLAPDPEAETTRH